MTSKRSGGLNRATMVNEMLKTASPVLIKARSLIDHFYTIMWTSERYQTRDDLWVIESFVASLLLVEWGQVQTKSLPQLRLARVFQKPR